MKRFVYGILACLLLALPYGGQADAAPPAEAKTQSICIQVGEISFTATLLLNDTTAALLERMPVTLDMQELHGNEKYVYFAEALPTDSERVGTIQTGDLMLYGADCLVLFYKDFSTSYSYTRLGAIDDTEGLAEALGAGAVTITLEILQGKPE